MFESFINFMKNDKLAECIAPHFAIGLASLIDNESDEVEIFEAIE